MATKRKRKSKVTRTQGWGVDSPAGRAGSARNAMKHGLTAMSILVPGESQKEFDAHLAGYIQQFKPGTSVENDLVQTMAVARWRLRRIPVIESNMVVNEIEHGSRDYDEIANDHQRVAYAFDRCNRALSLLTRYEGTLNRTFERAWKQLQELQKARLAAASEKLRNEIDELDRAPRPAPPAAVSMPSVPPSGLGASKKSRVMTLSGPHTPNRSGDRAPFSRGTQPWTDRRMERLTGLIKAGSVLC